VGLIRRADARGGGRVHPEELVRNSAGFRNGPDSEADDWKFIRGKIVADDGSVNYEGIELASVVHGAECLAVLNGVA